METIVRLSIHFANGHKGKKNLFDPTISAKQSRPERCFFRLREHFAMMKKIFYAFKSF